MRIQLLRLTIRDTAGIALVILEYSATETQAALIIIHRETRNEWNSGQ